MGDRDRAISADMRVGLDVQGCLQYSTEGGVLCSGDQDWMASTVVGPGLIPAEVPRSAYPGVRGSAPCARSGMPSGHAVSLSDSQEECVTCRSVLAVPRRTCYRWITYRAGRPAPVRL